MNEQYKFSTPIGPLFLVASDTALLGVYFRPCDLPFTTRRNSILRQTIVQLEEYFKGERREFDLKLSTSGTVFQETVWKELARIPYGRTLSYRELAAKIKSPKAVRAVGTANGRNPLSIVVPCHRVIAADGTLGGYGGGLSIKEQLLRLEKAM